MRKNSEFYFVCECTAKLRTAFPKGKCPDCGREFVIKWDVLRKEGKGEHKLIEEKKNKIYGPSP